jgi:hypothetical protein
MAITSWRGRLRCKRSGIVSTGSWAIRPPKIKFRRSVFYYQKISFITKNHPNACLLGKHGGFHHWKSDTQVAAMIYYAEIGA